MHKEKVEIYNLARKIDKVAIDDTVKNESIQVVVDLSQSEREEENLKALGLMTPIKEAERFMAIKRMKYAEELLEVNDAESTMDKLQGIIDLGLKAIDELMLIFTPAAFKFAGNWINNDRLNTRDDWEQIVYMALHEAIIKYDIEMQTQFNTFLGFKIKEICKENKCKSSILAVNPSAMHKARVYHKAKEAIFARGENGNDIDLLAIEVGRDISSPKKRLNFKLAIMDTENISPKTISTEMQVDAESRTLGESLEAPSLTPEEIYLANDIKRRLEKFYNSLSEDAKQCFKSVMGFTDKKVPKAAKALRNIKTEELKELLEEIARFSNTGFNFFDFIK